MRIDQSAIGFMPAAALVYRLSALWLWLRSKQIIERNHDFILLVRSLLQVKAN
jgi:hypothetical protein